MKNITFLNIDKKRVLFEPDNYTNLFEYFNLNKDATLVIDFYDLVEYPAFYSFDCLKNIKVRNLLLSGSKRANYDLSELMKMEELKLLDNRAIDLEYDFINFPNLETLRYTWNKNCKNISSLKKLKELSLWSYKPKNQDLYEFIYMNNIEEIRLVQSDIKSINGIEKLENLKELALVSNKNLSFDNFNHVLPKIEFLYIESCKKIDDGFCKLFPNLKKLEFVNNSSIDSLKNILENLKKLEYLNIAGTNILESDNRYWKNYSNLKINFLDKKHHILKRKDFNID
jgi:hypothetical protein